MARLRSIARLGAVGGVVVVAAVAVAACGGSSSPSTTTSSSSSATGHASAGVERNGTLAFAASTDGNLAYTFTAATATAGKVTISMTNGSGVSHNVALQEGTNGPVLGATPIESSGTHSVTLNLRPGTYTFFCQVPGHREAGMVGTLTVS